MNILIQEASLTGVLRLILIILFIYYAFSFIMRYLMPLMMRKYVNDFQKQFTGQNHNSQQEQNIKKEGEVSITFVDKDTSKTQNPDNADYVDYEEIN